MTPLLLILAAAGLGVWQVATTDVIDVRGVVAIVLLGVALGLWLRKRAEGDAEPLCCAVAGDLPCSCSCHRDEVRS